MSEKILFIEDRIPYPFLGAGFPRSFEILKYLNDSDCEITFYPILQDDYPEYFHQIKSELSNVKFLDPSEFGKKGLSKYLKAKLRNFDKVIVSRPKSMAKVASILDEISNNKELTTKIIYDAEAIASKRDIILADMSSEPLNVKEQRKLIEAEITPAKSADIIWSVSNQEKDDFISLGFKESDVRVVGHKIDCVRDTTAKFEDRSNLLFIGALHNDNTPNAHSILWFSKYVAPKLMDYDPGLILNVVGLNSSKKVSDINLANVKFLGKVDKLSSIYDKSKIFIAPTKFAAGIPLKVIEALGHGLPVITTSLIASQLGLRQGEDVLIADTPDGFVKQVASLNTNKTLWETLQENGYKFVDRNYSREIMYRQIQLALKTA